MPGKEQREAWTTAGFVRPDEISYQTPFQLGSVTLMITRGLNKDVPASQADRMANATSAPIQVVWMEMPGPIMGMTLSGRPRVSTSNDPDHFDGLMVNYQWVCIGFLRTDDFIPMMPNFASLLYVEMFSRGDPGDKHWNRHPEVDWTIPVRTSIVKGQLASQEIRLTLQVDHDKAVRGAPLKFMSRYSTTVLWKQLVPDPSPDAPVGVVVADIARFEQGRLLVQGEQEEVHNNLGSWTTTFVSDRYAQVRYKSVLPITEARRMFHVSAPAEFRKQLGEIRQQQQPCMFLRKNYEIGDQLSYVCAWRADDVAVVIYAQSYLMHVLTGPDRRRYEGVPEGVATRNVPNAKETQEPRPCFKVVHPRDPDAMDQIMLGGAGNIPFVSNGVSLRFFNPSLALRAARVLEENYGDLAMKVLTTYPDDGSRLYASLLTPPRVEILMRELEAMRIPLERFQEYEFMGTPIGSEVCDFGCLA